VNREGVAPRGERLAFRAFARLLASPAAFRAAARAARWLQKPFERGGRLRGLPLVFSRWTATRDLPPVARRTFHERWRELDRP
jgi:L-lactate dehydrogenase complex protein LldF